MALPIKPTPCLDEKESERFRERIEKDLSRPLVKKDFSKFNNIIEAAFHYDVQGSRPNIR